MNVRAKFRCQSVTHLTTASPGDVAAHITFFPVYEDGSGKNASWSKYTPNGKLDRKALPAPEGDAYSRHAYEPPQGKIEEALAQIWQQLVARLQSV